MSQRRIYPPSFDGLTDWQVFFLGSVDAANHEGTLRQPRPHEVEHWLRMHPKDAGRDLYAQIARFEGKDPWAPRPAEYFRAQEALHQIYR